MNDHLLVEFVWLSRESLAPRVRDSLTDAGVEMGSAEPGPVPARLLDDTDDAGFEPLLLIAGAAAAAHLARAISQVVRDHRQGGVVVDTRGTELTIRSGVRGVDAGTVVIVRDEGSQVISAPEEALLGQMFNR